MSGRRIAAVGALVIGLAALILALIVAVQEFPQGLVVLGLVCIAGVVAWYGVLRRGVVRAIGLSVGAIAFAAADPAGPQRARGRGRPDRRRAGGRRLTRWPR